MHKILAGIFHESIFLLISVESSIRFRDAVSTSVGISVLQAGMAPGIFRRKADSSDKRAKLC